MSERFAALKRARAEEGPSPTDFWANDHPICPHCAAECRVSDNDWWKLYEEGEHEVCCPSCGEDFTVTTRVSFSFSTDKQEGINDADPITSQGVQP
jgi:hypothetical protein